MTCILIKGKQKEIVHTQGVGENEEDKGGVKTELRIGMKTPFPLWPLLSFN